MAAGSKKVIFAALAGNGLIAITKLFAYATTHSSAMLSEAIHSLVDTGNQVLLLYGLKRAQRPADARFPFGHGKEMYFWGFVVAILIFAVGAGVSIYEGVHKLLHPEPIDNVMVSYAVLGLAMVFEGGSCFVAFREFAKVKGELGYLEAIHRGKDPSMFVVLMEDVAAMLGLVIALVATFLGQWTGWLHADGVASVLIGLILAGTAAWLAYETKSLLIGEAAEPGVVKSIHQLAKSHACVTHVNEVLTMHMGAEYVLVNVSLDFADQANVTDVERTIATLDQQIKAAHPKVKRIFVEAQARAR